jgi:hypothetical protein
VPYILRSPDEIGGLFHGLEMVEPGLVQIARPATRFGWMDDQALVRGAMAA